jgi:hypothetical protein
MMHGLRFRYLTFLGPNRESASLEFGAGLNVVYGASNTGKSFIVDTIDFMLGGRLPLRDFGERVGYDRILLGIETLDGKSFTIHRSTQGGVFTVYEGLHHAVPAEGGVELGESHSDRSDENLSSYLLTKVDLSKRRLRRNKRGNTQSLSFRNLARLMIVNEEEIIQQRSPLSDGGYIADTANTSVFKLLLTGVDDSALGKGATATPEETSREAQVELLDTLIKDLQHQVRELAGAPTELENQLDRLDGTMNKQAQQLAISESHYREVAGNRRDRLKKLDSANNRLTEVQALLDRFKLLDQHYDSDLARLRGIEEAGTLFSAYTEGDCPLCGASPEKHKKGTGCGEDVDAVVAAAKAEAAKVVTRRAELQDTVKSLTREAKSFERRVPKIASEAHEFSLEIETILAPQMRVMRSTYGELADKKVEVREALALYRNLKDLEERRLKLLEEEGATGNLANVDVELSTATVDKFAELVLSILKKWRFPDVERVHFDLKTRDLVINGKQRTSYGKGLRAITQAAFSIGLLEFCRENETPHPGIVMLDSPLLSYREPDSDADDLSHTDVNSHFYAYLAAMKSDRQVIIIENTDPPANIQSSAQATRFTGNPSVYRTGFFPVPKAAAASN